MASDWLVGDDRRSAASERIYAAAADLIGRRGADDLDLEALARKVNCSRATLYRYVGGKAQIKEELLSRSARRIVDSINEAVVGLSGPERVVGSIVAAVRAIRADPVAHRVVTGRRAPSNAMLTASPVMTRAAAMCSGIDPDDTDAALWIVRTVLVLVRWPATDPTDPEAERTLLQRFVAPAFTAGAAGFPKSNERSED